MIRAATTPASGWLQRYAESEGVEIVTANSRENPYLADGYIEEMMTVMSAAEVRVFIEGRFVPLSGQVFADYGDE